MFVLSKWLVTITFLLILLTLGGCATTRSTNVNDPVFDHPVPDGAPIQTDLLDSSIGVMTPEDAKKEYNYGDPDLTQETHYFKALAYSYVDASSLNLDSGIYAHRGQTIDSVHMVLVFLKPSDTLLDYKLVIGNREISSHTFTTKHLVRAGITALKFIVLQNLIEDALDDAVSDLGKLADAKWEQIKADARAEVSDIVDDTKQELSQFIDESDIEQTIDDAVDTIDDALQP